MNRASKLLKYAFNDRAWYLNAVCYLFDIRTLQTTQAVAYKQCFTSDTCHHACLTRIANVFMSSYYNSAPGVTTALLLFSQVINCHAALFPRDSIDHLVYNVSCWLVAMFDDYTKELKQNNWQRHAAFLFMIIGSPVFSTTVIQLATQFIQLHAWRVRWWGWGGLDIQCLFSICNFITRSLECSTEHDKPLWCEVRGLASYRAMGPSQRRGVLTDCLASICYALMDVVLTPIAFHPKNAPVVMHMLIYIAEHKYMLAHRAPPHRPSAMTAADCVFCCIEPHTPHISDHVVLDDISPQVTHDSCATLYGVTHRMITSNLYSDESVSKWIELVWTMLEDATGEDTLLVYRIPLIAISVGWELLLFLMSIPALLPFYTTSWLPDVPATTP